MGEETIIKNPRGFLLYGLLLTIISVVLCYKYVDIPLVEWAHAHQYRAYQWLHYAQQIPEVFPLFVFIIFIIVAIRKCLDKPTYLSTALMYASVSYVITYFLVRVFKIIFARTWPATWINENPSWLTDGVYGFFWLMNDQGFKSFPSGHTAAIFSVATVIGIFYPKLRIWCALACVFVITGLIGNYYHFLSDIIAGAYLGTATALLCLYRSKNTGYRAAPANNEEAEDSAQNSNSEQETKIIA